MEKQTLDRMLENLAKQFKTDVPEIEQRHYSAFSLHLPKPLTDDVPGKVLEILTGQQICNAMYLPQQSLVIGLVLNGNYDALESRAKRRGIQITKANGRLELCAA